MTPSDRKQLVETFRDGDRMDHAVKQAVKDALRQHKKQGNPVAVWDGEDVVIVPPEEIPGG